MFPHHPHVSTVTQALRAQGSSIADYMSVEDSMKHFINKDFSYFLAAGGFCI